MSLQYSHLLIPEHRDFTPQPAQVAAFFEGLVALNSAPLEATVRIAKSSGKVRTAVNPVTGETLSIPVRDFASLGSISDIPEQLTALDDYDIIMSGHGPAKLPPFTLYTFTESEEKEFKATYGYEVRCSLRPVVVSMCQTPPFGSPCPSEMRTGIFRHPQTGATIEVPNAACARFWIEFQFGNWLFPKIGNHSNLLEPSILSNAMHTFGTGFAQGGMYG